MEFYRDLAVGGKVMDHDCGNNVNIETVFYDAIEECLVKTQYGLLWLNTDVCLLGREPRHRHARGV